MKANINWKATAVLMILIIVGFSFAVFVSAVPGALSVQVVSIVSNDTLENVNVSLWNCTNNVLLNYTLTDQNGTAVLGINETWNFSVRLERTNFETVTYNNNSFCYIYPGTEGNLELPIYPNYIGSFNITVSDDANGRRVPNANVTVWKTNAPSDTKDMDYNLEKLQKE